MNGNTKGGMAMLIKLDEDKLKNAGYDVESVIKHLDKFFSKACKKVYRQAAKSYTRV